MKKSKESNFKKNWRLFDAKDKVLGRLATELAIVLSGKDKIDYTPYLDKGDYAVVINAKAIKFSGKKETKKDYFRHSGFPGGLRVKTAAQIRSQRPELLLRHAIEGMLPKNKLARLMIKKLFIYQDNIHPHEDKFKAQD